MIRHSMAYVNGMPVWPRGQGVKLYPGDIVEIGIQRRESRTKTVEQEMYEQSNIVLRIVVEPYSQQRETEREVDSISFSSPSFIKTALTRYCSSLDMPEDLPPPLSTTTLPSDPQQALKALRIEVVRDPYSVGAWLTWAQIAHRSGIYRLARDLFRAAYEAAQHSVEQRLQEQSSAMSMASSFNISSRTSRDQNSLSLPSDQGDKASSSSSPSSSASPSDEAVRRRWQSQRRLIQVLYSWGHMEWSLNGLQGTARHLWRHAADLAYAHPEGAEAGGHSGIALAWAKKELEKDNISHARIVVAEALRRAPDSQPQLYVLAGSIELASGNLGECGQ